MKLYFLRHGQSETNAAGQLGGQLDAPLTEKGIAQAEAAVDAVKKLNPDVIYCSPLMRARKTAEIVAEAVGQLDELIVDERIQERGIGVLEGADNQGGKLKVSTTPDDVEGVESIAELKVRAQDFLSDISKKHADQTVLIVAHGALIKMMVSLTADNKWEDIRDTFLPNGIPFQSFEEVT